VDVSPTLSLGAAINILDGDYDYDWEAFFADINDVYDNPPNDFDTTYVHDNKTADFDALSVKMGGLVRLNRSVRAGMTISSPVTYDISGDALERTVDVFDDGSVAQYSDAFYFQNEISTPWEFGFGMAWSVPTFLLAGDVHFADWSQMKFNDQPLDGYDETVSWNIGGEYIVPRLSTKIRAGYISEPVAFTMSDIVEDRSYVTLGAGFLVGQVMTMDVAWMRGSWKTAQPSLVLKEEIEVERIFLTAAYRF
jgi:long-subunit fatty acid transport protein